MKDVYRCAFPQDAVVMKSLLESAGIEAMVFNGDMLDVNPLFAVELGGTRISVSDEDAEDAFLIVADFEGRSERRETVKREARP
ncbi:MAG: DUF2007 domain-containing protein [Spirochaetes bacterium]|nr:DUF2007 domain-containing protein [Spirochaetota bacterium]